MHSVQQRQRLIPSSVYKQELAKCQLGDNIANHMGYIFTAILYDKFDMTFKQVTNYALCFLIPQSIVAPGNLKGYLLKQ